MNSLLDGVVPGSEREAYLCRVLGIMTVEQQRREDLRWSLRVAWAMNLRWLREAY